MAAMSDASPDRLARVGVALFGSRWQSDMAQALGVTDRTVRRWAAGAPIDASTWGKLLSIMQERRGILNELSHEIREVVDPQLNTVL